MCGQCDANRAQQSFRSGVAHKLSQDNCQTESTAVTRYGDGVTAHQAYGESAISLPAPLVFIAVATGIMPANRKMVIQSMEL